MDVLQLVLEALIRVITPRIDEAQRQAILQKRSLRRVIPELDWLLSEPGKFLRQQSITIGPRRIPGHHIMVGLVVGAAVAVAFLAACALILFILGLENRLEFAIPVALALFLVTWCAVVCLRKKPWCELRRSGVTFHCRGQVVFCPWSLFRTQGEAYVPVGRLVVVIPISTSALTRVTRRCEDRVVGEGVAVTAPHLEFRSGNELVLQSFYEVEPEELGELLLHLGHQLGTSASDESSAQSAIRDAQPKGNRGWVSISLTRPEFPPVCCSCETRTFLSHQFGYSSVSIAIPWCADCQHAFKQRSMRRAFLGCGIGLLCGIGFYLAMGAWLDANVFLLCPVMAIFAAGMGTILGKECVRHPVRLKYSDDTGLLLLKFQNPGYAELFQQRIH